ncbi:MAG: hemolysin family protein [Armatimonadetes bacterium]|nr:hemolysin family protein [Armatimonadota bacterium]MCX7968227.1 hemolysin family protein [Armatimonadota bacterium]MDW8142110.1 hemolysin family protein [Armatimonadota bacterium]
MSSDDVVITSLKLALATLLLWVSALFSASETALLGVGKVKVKYLAEEGNEDASRVLRLYRNPPKLIATLIAGITFSDYIAEALITSVALNWAEVVQIVGFSASISITFAFLVLTFIDVMPAIYGAAYADIVAFSVARWVALFQKLLSPLLYFVDAVVKVVLLLFGMKDAYDPPLVTEGEIFATLDVAERQGVITKEQKQMLASALEFKEVRVGEVMVPRVDMIAIRHDTLLDEAMRMMRQSGHSRLPVFRDTRDEIVGILHAKDVLSAWYRGERDKTAGELARPPLFATESQRAYNLLRAMQRQRKGMAIVLDEEGGTAGLVTVEDLLEEIVGEIYDEYDVAESPIRQVSENEFLVRAPLSIRQVEKYLGVELPEEDYDTLAELVVAHLEKLPQVGDQVELDGISLEVAEMRGRRISWVKVKFTGERV